VVTFSIRKVSLQVMSPPEPSFPPPPPPPMGMSPPALFPNGFSNGPQDSGGGGHHHTTAPQQSFDEWEDDWDDDDESSNSTVGTGNVQVDFRPSCYGHVCVCVVNAWLLCIVYFVYYLDGVAITSVSSTLGLDIQL
jgi:hypothetical protein